MQLKMSTILLDSFYTYSFMALFVIVFLNLVCIKRCDRGRPLTFHAFFWTTFLTLLTPVSVSVYVLFYLVWVLLGLALRVTYRNKFMGMFWNFDAMHSRSVIGKSCLSVLLMAECEDGTPHDQIFKSVTHTISNAVLVKKKSIKKLFSTLRHCFGYRFLLERKHIEIGDCVKKMKILTHCDVMTQSDLTELLVFYTKQPFPFDNEFLWDVHVGTQPVQWKKVAPGKKHYPILFRFHHCVADGVNIFNFITGVCGYSQQKTSQEALVQKRHVLIRLTKLVVETLLCGLLNPAISYTICVTRNDNLHLNIANVHKKGGSLIFQVDEQKTYLKKMYKIVRSCDVTFTSVLSTAFSASISDFYKSRYDSAPEYVTSLVPKHSSSLELRKLQPGSKSIDNVKFRNEYQLSFMQLPIQPEISPVPGKLSMLDRLSLVMDSLDAENRSSIFRTAVNRFIQIHFTICPEPLLKLSTYFLEFGPVISNIPGTPKMCLGEGLLPISDYIFYVTGMKRISFVLSATSYDNRLHLAIGTSLDIKWKELQKLLSNVYKYIDVLEREVDGLSGSSKDKF